MKYLIVMSLVLFCTVAVGEENADGNHLIQACGASVSAIDGAPYLAADDLHDAYFCLGLVHGVSDILVSQGKITAVTVTQSIRVVDRYLKTHPKDLSDRDTLLVVQALTEAFPKSTHQLNESPSTEN